jgi:hypothetical protein
LEADDISFPERIGLGLEVMATLGANLWGRTKTAERVDRTTGYRQY